MSVTPNRGLPLMEASQAQPEVVYNAAMHNLDAGENPLEVETSGASPGVTNVSKIKFVGATITEETGGVAVVTIDGTSGGGGGSLELTDGVHDLTGVTKITVTGATVGGSSAAATLTFSGGGSGGGVPSTIADLAYWLKGDTLAENMSTGGGGAQMLPNFLPFWPGESFVRTSATLAAKAGSTLNSLGYLSFAGGEHYVSPAGSIAFAAPGGLLLKEASIFIVFKASAITSSANGYSICSGGGGAGGLEMRLTNSGAVAINDGTTSLTGTTGLVVNNTWYQANITYSSATGAYVFRVAESAAGSGTSALSVSKGTNGLLFYNISGSFNLDFVGGIAEIIIYDRALSSPEVATIEAYLLAKWGV